LQLDTWFGTRKKERGRGGGGGGGGGGGQLLRPHSEVDMNELEWKMFVEQLDASEELLNEKFEDMLVCTKYSSAVIVVGFVQRHML
jgi:hypothetical protein